MQAAPVCRWPVLSLLLITIVMGALFVALNYLAVTDWHWWADSTGWTGGMSALVGATVGSLIHFALMTWSSRRHPGSRR